METYEPEVPPEAVADVLERAATYTENGWCQRAWQIEDDGLQVCASEALTLAARDYAREHASPMRMPEAGTKLYNAGVRALVDHLGIDLVEGIPTDSYVIGWNDDARRKRQEILDGFHGAAKAVLGVDDESLPD